MPPLPNSRHERFAQAVFEGHTADESYVLAGYMANRGNATRMEAIESIRMRLMELQAAAARKSAVTLESIYAKLDEAIEVFKANGQGAALVSVSALKAKLAGLMVERVEIGGVGAFDRCKTPGDVLKAMLAALRSEGVVVSEAEQAELDGLMHQIAEFPSAIAARPVWATDSGNRDRQQLTRR
jgi:hypothetical protein